MNGGLELGVQAALGGSTAWVSDIDKGACKILAHRYPDTPNLGDISTVDWSAVEPVDVLTGGFPCQDVSHAGKRAGLRPDTRTGLWSQMAYAIDQLRPRLVVAENVRGLLSAEAHSDLEPCPWCMGDGEGLSPLRALGAVLGDLADIGYDACWYGLRAADVGAAHGRFRVFVVAYPASDAGRVGYGDGGPAPIPECSGWERGGSVQLGGAPVNASGDGEVAADAGRLCGQQGWPAGAGEAEGGRPLGELAGRGLLPTPRATDGTKGGPNQRGSSGDLMLPSAAALLPTPAVNDMGAAYTPEEWDAWTGRMKAEHGNGNGHGKSLSIEAARLLPTPTAMDYTASGGNSDGANNHGTTLTDATVRQPSVWGQYADAIARWEHVLGRPAPAPTMTSTKGNPQLSPAFVEWLMGLPVGWVTDVPGITRNEALKALGNGVVPAQAEAAIRYLLGAMAVAA